MTRRAAARNTADAAWRSPLVACTIAWCAAVLFTYGQRVVVPDGTPLALWWDARTLAGWSPGGLATALGRAGWAVLVVATLGLAALGVGGVVGRWVRIVVGGRSRGHEAWLATFGLGLLGSAVLGLGFLGLYRVPVFAVLMVPAVLGMPGGGRAKRRHAQGWGWLGLWPLVISAAAVAGMAASALAPEIETDSLKYHLAKPAQYLLAGRLGPSHTPFDSYPSLWEALLVPLFAVGGEASAKLAGPAVIALTGLLLRETLERVAAGAGAVGAMLYVTGAGVSELAVTAKNDALVALFVLAAFAAWLQRRRGAALAVTGVCLGLAFAVKYTAVLGASSIAFLVLAGSRSGGRVRNAAWMAMGWAVGYAPWGFRNFLDRGNPAFPLLPGILGPGLSAAAARLQAVEAHRYTAAAYVTAADKLRAVWSLAVTEGLWVVPALALPACVVQLSRRAQGRPWAVGGMVMVAAWIFGPPQGRFLLQGMTLLAGAMALALVTGTAPRWRRAWLVVALGVGAVETIHGWTSRWSDRGARVAVAVGAVTPDAYRLSRLGACAEAFGWADQHLPADAHVLVYGTIRAFPLARRVTLTTELEPLTPLALAAAARDDGHLARKMRAAGFTHLLYDRGGALAWAEPMATLVPGRIALSRWARYWRGHARLIHVTPRQDSRPGPLALYALDRRAGPQERRVLPGEEPWLVAPPR